MKMLHINQQEAVVNNVATEERELFDLTPLNEIMMDINSIEENAIYYVAGYVCNKFLKIHTCELCKKELIDEDKLLTDNHQLFT